MHNANDEDDVFEEDTEKWMEKKRAEHIRELRAELAKLDRALQFAAGFIKGARFNDKSTQWIYEWLIESSKP